MISDVRSFQSFLSVVLGFRIHLNKRYQFFFEMNVLFTFFMMKKPMTIFGKNKFVCKLMHFERDDAQNVATRR